MKKRHHIRLVHQGDYVAEVDVELVYTDEGWSPYLSLDDAQELDDLWDFAVNFKEWFSCLLEEHRANGYVGSPMTFLWLKVKERFPEQDLSDF